MPAITPSGIFSLAAATITLSGSGTACACQADLAPSNLATPCGDLPLSRNKKGITKVEKVMQKPVRLSIATIGEE